MALPVVAQQAVLVLRPLPSVQHQALELLHVEAWLEKQQDLLGRVTQRGSDGLSMDRYGFEISLALGMPTYIWIIPCLTSQDQVTGVERLAITVRGLEIPSADRKGLRHHSALSLWSKYQLKRTQLHSLFKLRTQLHLPAYVSGQ